MNTSVLPIRRRKESGGRPPTALLMPCTNCGTTFMAVGRMRVCKNCHSTVIRTPTVREWQVIVLLCQGLSYKEIAGQLDLGADTIKVYMGHVKQKLRLRNNIEVVLWALPKLPNVVAIPTEYQGDQ